MRISSLSDFSFIQGIGKQKNILASSIFKVGCGLREEEVEGDFTLNATEWPSVWVFTYFWLEL